MLHIFIAIEAMARFQKIELSCKFSNFLIIGMPSENEVSSALVSVVSHCGIRLILTVCI